jgi:hypothetical protein
VLQEAPPVGGLGLLDKLGPGAVFCLVVVASVVVPDRGRGYGKGVVLDNPVDGVPLVDAPVRRVPVHLGERARRLVALGIEAFSGNSIKWRGGERVSNMYS